MGRTLCAALLVTTVLATACFNLEDEERYYTKRMQQVYAIEAKATKATKAEILAKKDALAKRYAALPTTPKERRDALDGINVELDRLIRQYGDRVDNEALAAEVGPLAGTWRGNRVTLTIKPDLGFSYGRGSSTWTGRFSSVQNLSITTKIFDQPNGQGTPVTYGVQKPPYQDTDGKWKMVFGGDSLTRD
jgi:hypothetical protein